MTEDFVSFELAKKLKEKGFPQYTEKSYFVGDHKKRMCSVGTFLHVHTQNAEHLIAAPTIAQVFKWLREEKKYHIEFVGNACGYLFIVSDIPSEGGTDRYCSDYSGPNDGGTWDKYEDCALSAIEYVLDNLI